MDDNQWDQLYGWESSLLSICAVIQSYLEDFKSPRRLKWHTTAACGSSSFVRLRWGSVFSFARESGRTYKEYHATTSLISLVVLPPFLSRSSIFSVQLSFIHWPSHVTRPTARIGAYCEGTSQRQHDPSQSLGGCFPCIPHLNWSYPGWRWPLRQGVFPHFFTPVILDFFLLSSFVLSLGVHQYAYTEVGRFPAGRTFLRFRDGANLSGQCVLLLAPGSVPLGLTHEAVVRETRTQPIPHDSRHHSPRRDRLSMHHPPRRDLYPQVACRQTQEKAYRARAASFQALGQVVLIARCEDLGDFGTYSTTHEQPVSRSQSFTVPAGSTRAALGRGYHF